MTFELGLMKAGVFGAWSAATLLAGFAIARDEASLPLRYWKLYVAYLERKLRNMFITVSGDAIVLGQLFSGCGSIALGIITRDPSAYLLLAPALFGPAAYIEQLRKRRVRAIDGQIDGFTLSLANALKATPSIGNALGYVQPLLPEPLAQEVGLALKEMKLGHTVEQVLLSMGVRIRSVQLDAVLSSLLIGRQVGGDVGKILEKTAATLREMARLAGVVRTKTAEGKAQLSVLAAFPVLIVFMFDTVSAGYFDPLTHSVVGWVIIVSAVVLWIASLLIARKVLEVDL